MFDRPIKIPNYSALRFCHLQVLPHTMLEKVQQFGDKFKLMLEARVVKVEQDNDKVLMILIMTVMLMVVRTIMMRLTPPINWHNLEIKTLSLTKNAM